MVKKEIPIIAIIGFMILLGIPINAYADFIWMNNLTGGTTSNGYDLSGCATDSRIMVGETVTATSALLNKAVNRITFIMDLDNVGDQNTVVVGVWDGTIAPTAVNYKKLFGSFDSSTVGVNDQRTFTVSTAYTLVQNDVIGIYFRNANFADLCSGKTIFSLRATAGDTFNGTSSTIRHYQLATNTWISTTTDDARLKLELVAQPEVDFCSKPENVNLLRCRIGGSGSFGNLGAFVIGQPPTNSSSGTGLTGMSCDVGLVDCLANPDIKTNGLGYLYLAITLGIYIGILWIASRASLMDIPNYIWITGLIAVVAFTTIVQWIDPTILIVVIIVIIALAGIRSKNIFSGGGGLFKGEST